MHTFTSAMDVLHPIGFLRPIDHKSMLPPWARRGWSVCFNEAIERMLDQHRGFVEDEYATRQAVCDPRHYEKSHWVDIPIKVLPRDDSKQEYCLPRRSESVSKTAKPMSSTSKTEEGLRVDVSNEASSMEGVQIIECSDDESDMEVQLVETRGENRNNSGVHSDNPRRLRRRRGRTSQYLSSTSRDDWSDIVDVECAPQSSRTTTRGRRGNLGSDAILQDDLYPTRRDRCRSRNGSSARSDSDSSDCCCECDGNSSTDLTPPAKVGGSHKQCPIVVHKVSPTPSYPVYSLLKPQLERDGRQIDYIRGDGNCFFRAVSKNVFNSEENHADMRQMVVDVLERHPEEFKEFIDGDTQDHIKEMRQDGTWATTAEIFAAAVLLQRDIYVLSPDFRGEKYEWMRFSPKLRYRSEMASHRHPCYLTLCHTNGNHYDSITGLNGVCNCSLPPPKLSGVKAYIDLTGN